MENNDIREAYSAAQEAADDKFKEMVGGPQYYEAVVGKKTYGLLGLCGFVRIRFKGVKEKNLLTGLGIDVQEHYFGGFSINPNNFYGTPGWAKDLDGEAEADYCQSMEIKNAAAEAFLKVLQKKGILKEAYIEMMLD